MLLCTSWLYWFLFLSLSPFISSIHQLGSVFPPWSLWWWNIHVDSRESLPHRPPFWSGPSKADPQGPSPLPDQKKQSSSHGNIYSIDLNWLPFTTRVQNLHKGPLPVLIYPHTDLYLCSFEQYTNTVSGWSGCYGRCLLQWEGKEDKLEEENTVDHFTRATLYD